MIVLVLQCQILKIWKEKEYYKKKKRFAYMNLYVADLHFEHSNCIRLDHRPFADVDEQLTSSQQVL
jgi:hypothetical protein